MMSGVVARIILRYVSGALVSYGFISMMTGETLAADPDVALVLGVAIAGGVEWLYRLALKYGWRT